MTDFAINVFRLVNSRGYSVPALNISYIEIDTGAEWRMTCGGSRAYLVRFGASLDHSFNAQSADSHFMVRRITSSLLLGGVGLFQAEAMGRLLFEGIEGTVTWHSHLNLCDFMSEEQSDDIVDSVYDWCQVLCQHTVLRRAADDAHLALTYPHEALVFVYRGLEWLKLGLKITWKDLASDIGVSVNQIKKLKKTANIGTGVRHATPDGHKMRADAENYGTWVCGLVDAINASRARLDHSYQPMSSEQVGSAIMRAMPIVPFP